MTIMDNHRFRGLRRFWRSGEGPALLASLVFCVVTSVFMAPSLPVEEGFGAVGVLFIYATVFVLVAGIVRMAIGSWRKRVVRRGGAA